MAVEDIRTVSPEQSSDVLRSILGADGLMTYRYLGRTINTLNDTKTMKLRRDMRNSSGGLLVAPLAIIAPETGGFADADTVSAPVTASIHILDDGRDVRELAVRRRPIHSGRMMGFGSVEIVDGEHPDRVVAIVAGTGMKIGTAPPDTSPIEDPPDVPDSPTLPPLAEAFGARRRESGVWELPPLDPRFASTSASLHLGPIHVAFEAAATDLAAEVAGTDALQVEDWNVLFVARGTHGPFVVTGDAVAGRAGRIACRMHLRDEGRGDRVVAWASAVFRRAD